MTYHSLSKWTFDDKVTDEVVREVVEGLEYHKNLNDGKQYTPSVYIKMTAIDGCIHFIGRILDSQARGDDLDIDNLIKASPESAKLVVRRVLEKIAKKQK